MFISLKIHFFQFWFIFTTDVSRGLEKRRYFLTVLKKDWRRIRRMFFIILKPNKHMQNHAWSACFLGHPVAFFGFEKCRLYGFPIKCFKICMQWTTLNKNHQIHFSSHLFLFKVWEELLWIAWTQFTKTLNK